MKQVIDIQNIRYTGQISDPVSDLLARMRNAGKSLHDEVAVPSSRLLEQVARIFKREGYIDDFRVEQGSFCKVLVLRLRYSQDRKHAITGLKRISKPGRREYAGKARLPKVLGGLGIAVMSTSRGIMTSKEAAGHGVGGEVLCHIW